MTSNGSGTLTDNSDGTWSYVVVVADAMSTVTFNFNIDDGHGGVPASAESIIENNTPTITTTYSNIEMQEDNGTTAYNLNVSDIDGGQSNS